MKKTLIAFGVAAAGFASVLIWKFETITDPYVVKPLAVIPAANGAPVGYSIENSTRTLSIVSSNRVVVVADPGASFQYEELWLLEEPRKDGLHSLMEYKCELPKYASADHINPISSTIPAKIRRTAEGNNWQ